MSLSKLTGSQPARIFLDYASATPVRPEVLKAMQPYQAEIYGNPGSIHAEGRSAEVAVSGSRLALARTLGVRPEEIIFTSGGTEANNLALTGCVNALIEKQGLKPTEIEIITTELEHPSILAVLSYLKEQGVTITYAPVDDNGFIDLSALVDLLNPQVKLISLSYGNGEIGTVQPMRKIARLVKKHQQETGNRAFVHTDASQMPRWLSCHLPSLGVDAMTLDAGKCEGPKGVGLLVALEAMPLKGLLLGGGQERGLRAGTEPTALIVGAVEAIKLAQAEWPAVNKKVGSEATLLFKTLKHHLPNIILNGPEAKETKERNGESVFCNRLPNNLNISLPGADTEYATIVLDKEGIAVSTKSTCGGKADGSKVVKVISGDDNRALSTIRFSLGPKTNLNSQLCNRVAKLLKQHTKHMEILDLISK